MRRLLEKLTKKVIPRSVWARPHMKVTFRAELMPGKSVAERTFVVNEVLRNGRVTLCDFAGEHRQSEFEPVRFDRN